MRCSALALVIVLVTLTHSHGDDVTGSSIDDFVWLKGDWVRQTKRGEATESWTRVSVSTMEGVASVMSDGSTRISEYLRIEQFGDDVFYTAKPGENPFPTPFKLIEFDEARFVFENPRHDFPQRIIYTRVGTDSLTVRIEGSMEGEERRIDFSFERKR